MSENPPFRFLEYTKSLAIAFVLALIIKIAVVEAYKIPSSSMEDTLLVGDFLLANKFIYGAQVPFTDWRLPAVRDPQQGDIVIFKYPVDRQTNYIKRCVATAGQTVEIINKVLYVDGKVFENPPESKFTSRHILPYSKNSPRDNFPPKVVPPNHIFCMGDNRDKSSDSRFWGTVSLDLIQGQAVMIHWSWVPDVNEPQVKLDDLTTIPASVLHFFVHFYERVRWRRLGNILL
ncbi:MAG: signal peptidase I [candidate division Zixibacteria bacterium]|nr:signal peptidase I [candidate division Zixibacteria bacterium]